MTERSPFGQAATGRRVNANLVVFLDGLLAERSVAGAAMRLHVSESAVTSALRKLRSLSGDALLVRGPGGMVLTPMGRELQRTAQSAIAAVSRALEGGPQFDATVSHRTFSIAMSEFTQSQIGAELIRLVRRRAPGVRLHFGSLSGDGFTLDTLFRRDVVLAHVGSGVKGLRRVLFQDDLVPIVDSGNRRLRNGALSDEDLAGLRLVLGAGGQSVPEPVQRMFEGGVMPPVGVNVVGDHLVPYAVRGTDLIGIVPRRRAVALASLGLVIPDTSMARVQIVEAAHWHPSKRLDPAVLWLVSILEEAVTAAGIRSSNARHDAGR